MKPLIFPVLAAFSLLAAPLQAQQEQPVVVELFTSQGCSSCPDADAMLAELAEREDIIALALHVDYWDYIGWEDPFGDPAHAERQRGYAAVGGRRSVYTPELIVQGQTDIVGAKPMKLMDAVERHAEAAPQVALTVARSGGAVEITADPLAKGVGPMQVHMLRYSPMERTKVTRGKTRAMSWSTATWCRAGRSWRTGTGRRRCHCVPRLRAICPSWSSFSAKSRAARGRSLPPREPSKARR
ncbi:DUF1223 domain-containing protein [Sulfitobacter faviae]|uniref:DUF1223 domain-containing protein n=1 Tax=Sulfitobacter faviae TaxID=1775881 RepID=UPI0031BA31AB